VIVVFAFWATTIAAAALSIAYPMVGGLALTVVGLIYLWCRG